MVEHMSFWCRTPTELAPAPAQADSDAVMAGQIHLLNADARGLRIARVEVSRLRPAAGDTFSRTKTVSDSYAKKDEQRIMSIAS
eukprot:scaffold157312_cov47-Prasinocladus_malaysianus.AAC.1